MPPLPLVFAHPDPANEPAADPKPQAGRSRSARSAPVNVEPWLAQALRSRWKLYRGELAECRKAPSEKSVHNLRVAIRRLISQVILLDVILPGGKAQRTLKMLKRQLKSLGPLRDLHVQQVFIQGREARFPEVGALLDHLEGRERKLIKDASRCVGRFRVGKLGGRIRSLLGELEEHAGEAARRKRLVALAVRRAAEAFAETVERRRQIDFSDLGSIHRTRVAFKKFRYIVESLPPGLTGLTKRDLRNLAWYQRRMGNIQDLEVIQASLKDYLRRHKGGAGLPEPFFAYLRRRRARALLSFRKSADKLLGFWPPPALPARPGARLLRD